MRITPAGAVTATRFNNGNDGCAPVGLTKSANGTFYAVTRGGGVSSAGAILNVTPAGIKTLIHSFDGTNGFSPSSPLSLAGDGNFYGGTNAGGSVGSGVLYRLTPQGGYAVVHDFANTPDGSIIQYASPVQDSASGPIYIGTVNGGKFGRGAIMAITAPADIPPNLTAQRGENQVFLTWAVAPRAVSYNIYRGTTTNGQSAVPVATGVTSNLFTDSELTNDIPVFYKVTAVNAEGDETQPSNEATATPADLTPDSASVQFAPVNNAEPLTVYVSNTVTVAGVSPGANVPFTISGGRYSKNGGAMTTTAGVINNGDTLAVEVTSPMTFGTRVLGTINFGPRLSSSFVVTNRKADTTPNAFGFTAVNGAELSTLVVSNSVTLSGLEPGFGGTPVTVSNGEYSINGAAFTSTAGTVRDGDTVRVRTTSAPTTDSRVIATLRVGAASGNFVVTTRREDTTPNSFTFAQVVNAELTTIYTSNTVTISGLEPGFTGTPLSVSNGSYSLNGAAFTTASGTVKNGDTLTLRTTSSGSFNTRVLATARVGMVSSSYAVTTRRGP